MAQSTGRNRRSRATRPRRVGEALAVVKGLDVFQNHFARYADQYVLIGGTAATLAMEEAGLEFRATKDLDIVLQLSQMLAPDSRIKVAAKIADDLDRFLGSLITDGSYDPKSVGVDDEK